MGRLLMIAAALWALALAGPAAAASFGFENITGNSAVDAAAGESQLSVDVLDAGPGAVEFRFWNIGPDPMSITDVYFDDGTLLMIATIDNSDPGVSFMQPASPPNLPGGNMASPPFVTSAGFLADSDPPAQPNGVNPGETLGITFSLQAGGTLGDVLSELDTGMLRIGIHVQGFAGGGSESFINAPPAPEPAAWALLALTIGGLAVRRARR